MRFSVCLSEGKIESMEVMMRNALKTFRFGREEGTQQAGKISSHVCACGNVEVLGQGSARLNAARDRTSVLFESRQSRMCSAYSTT